MNSIFAPYRLPPPEPTSKPLRGMLEGELGQFLNGFGSREGESPLGTTLHAKTLFSQKLSSELERPLSIRLSFGYFARNLANFERETFL